MMVKLSQWLMASVCLVLVVLAASLSWLRAGIDDHPQYHQWVEQQVSRAVGQPLTLASFEAKLVGTDLQLSLAGIETEAGLSLMGLALGVDLWGSLEDQALRLSHVQAEGLTINLGQQEDGRWGPQADLETKTQTLPQLMLALATRVPQLLLHDVILTLTSNQGQSISVPKLNAQVQLTENVAEELTRLSLYVFAGEHGQTNGYDINSQVTVDFKTHPSINAARKQPLESSLQRTIQRANIYLHSNGIELAPLMSLFVPEKVSPFYLDRLRLGGSYWLHYGLDKGLELVTKDAQLVMVTPTNQMDILGDISATSQLNNDTSFDWQLAHWNVTAQALSGQVNGVTLPVTELQVSKTNQQLVIHSPKLHLADTQALINSIKNVPVKINLPIQSLAPKGWLHQAQLHLDMHQPKAFLFAGQMQQVSIEAWSGVPQITQADGHIWLNRYGGKLAINDTDGLQVHLTTLASLPWQLSGLKGEFNWHYSASANRISSSNMHIKLGQGQANLTMAAEFPRKDSVTEPFIQLALGLQDINLERLPGLLPDLVMGDKLGTWLTTAAPMGRLKEAGLIYNGRPGNIATAAGVMARSMPMAAYIEAPSFSYHQDWPQVQGLKADLTLDHTGLQVKARAGSVAHSQTTQSVKGWQVEVPVYQTATKNPGYIKVRGQLAGEASQMMMWAQKPPLRLDLPSWLAALKPKGDVTLQGRVAIPFGHQAKVTYDLQLSSDSLNGYWAPLQADVRHVELEVGLSSARGGIGAVTGSGLVDGQLISFERLSKVGLAQPWLSRIPDKILDDAKANLSAINNSLTLQFKGQLPPYYLATKFNQPWLQQLSGPLPFVARLSSCPLVGAECTSLSAEVDLTQAAIDLPDPLQQLQQLQLLGHWQQNQQNWYASLDQHQLAVKLGRGENTNDLTVLGTNVAFQGAVDWAQQGQWQVGGQIDFVDVEEWWELYKKGMNWWSVTADQASTDKASKDPAFADKPPAGLILPQIDVKIKRATWFGLDIDQTTLTLEKLAAEEASTLEPWRLRLTSEQLAGQVDYFGAHHPLVIQVDHAHLNFPEADTETDEDVDLLENIDPSKFPDADVSINELLKNGESFGQWQFKTRRQGTQVNVHDLDAYIRHSHLQGNLIWDKVDGAHRTQFTGLVESSDISSLLVAWGYGPALVAETSALEVQLEWPRSPLAFAVKDASGDLGLRIKKGSFSAAPGATKGLKILALLDMNRLMQRVKLDFSDIIEPGFNFDSIAVLYRFDHGLASTVAPLTLKSTALNLSMDGWIDFNKRRVDNNLIVTLPLAEKLPLAALIAGLPQLSGMIYLVNKLIGDELSTFTSARYEVVGSLDNPDVKLVKIFDKDYQNQSIQERIGNVIPVE